MLSIAEAIGTAIALHKQGDLAKAEHVYKAILDAKPDHFDALRLLGVLEAERSNFEKAADLFTQAIRARPGFAPPHMLRGNALYKLNRMDEALASYEQALAIKPDYVEALSNRGDALLALLRPEAALASYDRALTYRPNVPKLLTGRGNALRALKRDEEALASYGRALAISPDYFEAIWTRALTLHSLGRHREALAGYDDALKLKPDHVETLNNRSFVLNRLGRQDEAIGTLELLLKHAPDHKYARGAALDLKKHCCDWSGYAEGVAATIAGVRAGKPVVAPFVFFSMADSPADQLRCARIFAHDRCPATAGALWKGERYKHDRIRVAYLSSDFYNHPVAQLIVGVLERHDRSRFEVSAFSYGIERNDEMRRRLKAAFERFVDVGPYADEEAARMLREREIDIAIEMKGFTEGPRPRILSFRPVPVQVNYFGYAGTMGVDFLDYIIADKVVIPEDERDCYAEKVVYLPDTLQPNDDKRRIGDRTPTRREAGLPEDAFVFCSFNAAFKITPTMFDVWMRLLGKVERSVLWQLTVSPVAERNLRREAELRGVPGDRLIFAPYLPLADHLARFRLADLFLDVLPFNSHTSASDALWGGLPIVTCLGTTYPGRVAASLLGAVGLPELVAHSLEEYEALALKLATDAAHLAEVKAKLARNRLTQPLFDTDRYRRHLEWAYERMWLRYQEGRPPASFAVPRAPS